VFVLVVVIFVIGRDGKGWLRFGVRLYLPVIEAENFVTSFRNHPRRRRR
jgi:hypothetical protein